MWSWVKVLATIAICSSSMNCKSKRPTRLCMDPSGIVQSYPGPKMVRWLHMMFWVLPDWTILVVLVKKGSSNPKFGVLCLTSKNVTGRDYWQQFRIDLGQLQIFFYIGFSERAGFQYRNVLMLLLEEQADFSTSLIYQHWNIHGMKKIWSRA